MTSAEALRLHCLDVILERSTPEPNTGCWLWAGAVSHNGYGVAWAAGKKVRANRFAWMVAHGPIAETLVICHRCDQPSCVNPDHLFIGSQGDNVEDMCRKGRSARGDKHGSITHPEALRRAEDHPGSKLTWSDVAAIREARRFGQSIREVGRMFGISYSQVSAIATGKCWVPRHHPNQNAGEGV